MGHAKLLRGSLQPLYIFLLEDEREWSRCKCMMAAAGSIYCTTPCVYTCTAFLYAWIQQIYYSQNILFLGKGSGQIGSVASIRTSPGRALCLLPCKQLRRVYCWWPCEVIWCRAMHWAWRLLLALFFRVTKIPILCLWFCERLIRLAEKTSRKIIPNDLLKRKTLFRLKKQVEKYGL